MLFVLCLSCSSLGRTYTVLLTIWCTIAQVWATFPNREVWCCCSANGRYQHCAMNYSLSLVTLPLSSNEGSDFRGLMREPLVGLWGADGARSAAGSGVLLGLILQGLGHRNTSPAAERVWGSQKVMLPSPLLRGSGEGA